MSFWRFKNGHEASLIICFPFKVDPKFVDKLNIKDASLDSRLKDVYVTSQDRFVGCDSRQLRFHKLMSKSVLD